MNIFLSQSFALKPYIALRLMPQLFCLYFYCWEAYPVLLTPVAKKYFMMPMAKRYFMSIFDNDNPLQSSLRKEQIY